MAKVIDKLFNSIVFRMGAMMFGISFVAIISMFSSVFISEMADKDALAINHAGSLRMQTYKVMADFQQNRLIENQNSVSTELTKHLNEFEVKLSAPVLNQPISDATEHIINRSLNEIKYRWFSELKPTIYELSKQNALSENQLITLRSQIDTFVLQIDHLVSLYQQHAEDRLLLIRMIQWISLFITVILVVVIMLQLNHRVEKPLSELTNSANRIMAGDYTAHTHIAQSDELGFLSRTMNKMADAISESHLQLEKRVKLKTAELRQSKESLELLYEASTILSQSSKSLDLEPIIEKLSSISGLDDLDLCLMTNEGSSPYEHILTTEKELAKQCLSGDCSGCITETVGCSTDNNKSKRINMRYPLRKGELNFGVLICNLKANTSLEAWQHQLLQSIAAQIATGLKLRQQSEQTRRLALVSERTVIARELHDSLAQALSYLKIQVTRLQKLHQRESSSEQIEEVVDELKSGLSSAYRQLRELLTTFRLKIDAEGLQSAFEKTITQLNERADGKLQFSLDYRIGDLPLTPNEEIHIMQIAREATQNALHHSQGKQARVALYSDQDKCINLIIEDDGVGLGSDPEKLNHYGLAIMKERAVQLGAQISIQENQPSGTIIKVNYKPSYVANGPVNQLANLA